MLTAIQVVFAPTHPNATINEPPLHFLHVCCHVSITSDGLPTTEVSDSSGDGRKIRFRRRLIRQGFKVSVSLPAKQESISDRLTDPPVGIYRMPTTGKHIIYKRPVTVTFLMKSSHFSR